MRETRASIGQVKRDISELVNRVAYGGERIVLTSRGKAKAALVSIEDLERLQGEQGRDGVARWRLWVARTDELVAEMLARRGGARIDVDNLLRQEREELEGRGDWIAGGH